jgi:DNA-binding NarL/FixJ family response regulator
MPTPGGRSTVNVFVIDSNAIYRRGIAASLVEGLPEVETVAEASSVDDARIDPALPECDVLIIDHDAPGAHDFIRSTCSSGRVHVVVCSSSCDEPDLRAAMSAGAVGVLSKDTLTAHGLIGAVRASVDGTTVLTPELLGQLLAGARGNGGASAQVLTSREQRVLGLIADGHAIREVAHELSYSERTVKNVMHDVVLKLNAKSRSQAVAQAVRSGLI